MAKKPNYASMLTHVMKILFKRDFINNFCHTLLYGIAYHTVVLFIVLLTNTTYRRSGNLYSRKFLSLKLCCDLIFTK